MTQPSQPLATQRYTLVDSSQTNGRHTSPILEEADEADAGSDGDKAPSVNDGSDRDGPSDDESRRSSSDSDDAEPAIPIVRPLNAARRAASQGPAIRMPTLSSLDTSILRNGHGRPAARRSMAASQPLPKSKALEESSESEDTSSEEEAPVGKKGRYATGRGRPVRAKAKTNGVMRGW
jgi:hypothetical protein